MMNIGQFSVKNSLLVNLSSVFIIIAGCYAMLTMQREAFPSVNYDIVTISTVWPGAPAEDVEKFVTIPLEEELRSVSGLDEMTSKTDEGLSEIGIYIDPAVTDKDKVVDDIQRAVDRVTNLPEDAEDPLVFELDSREFPVIEVSLSGPQPEGVLREYAESLKDELSVLDGVSQVREIGWRDKEFQIEVNPLKLREYHVSIEEIMGALNSQNVTVPAGQLTTSQLEYNVRITGEFRTVEQIANVIIRSNDAGFYLRVKDMAEVYETFEDPTRIPKINGHDAMPMVVVKTEDGDAIDVVDRVMKTIDKFEAQMPEGMEITLTNDYSYYVKRRLGVLNNNGILGFFLVIIILFLFLDPIPALLTAVGIPIALFMSFIVMSFFGITINLVSMLGIILVLGMLVDDGIIVSENVYRRVEEGMDPKEAAVIGTNEVVAPVTATILTTFAAFAPLMFMSDIIGKFIREIPLVVMITLGASLFEAFIVLPSHLSDVMGFFKNKIKAGHEKKWFVALKAHYTRVLRFSLDWRYLVIALLFLVFLFSLGLVVPLAVKKLIYTFALAILAVLFISGFVLKNFRKFKFIVLVLFTAAFLINFNMDKGLKFLLFAGEGIEYFSIRAEAKKGTPLEKTADMLKQVEEIVAGLPEDEVENFRSYTGSIEEEGGFDPNAKRGSHFAQITVFLTPLQQRERDPQEIADEVRAKLKDVEGFEDLSIYLPKEGPPTGPAVEVGIKGEDFLVMEEIAEPIIAYLHQREGVSDVQTSYDFGKKQIHVVVDEEKAKKYFLTVGQIASTVRNVFQGGVATTIKPEKAEEEIDVLVRFPKPYRENPEVFGNILIPNGMGNLVPLDAVARLEDVEGIFQINHLDGKRILYVTANVDNETATSLEVNTELQQKFRGAADDYLGYSIVYGGEFEDQMESFRNLMTSYVFALFLIFILLVAMFRSLIQPFIVMSAIPFGVIGVIVSFWLHDILLPGGRPLNFFALMGLVGLTGIVVNDSVVLVDFINRIRKEGIGRRESIVDAGQKRLRPVIMTSVTTIGGLVSVAYGFWGGDPFLKPMALAVVWGLVFSTMLTLVGIPCLYAIFDDFTEKVLRRRMVKMDPETGKAP